MVGLEILRGKQLKEGGVTPQDWLNVAISLLCHGSLKFSHFNTFEFSIFNPAVISLNLHADIGYVKGVCKEDNIREHVFATGKGTTIKLDAGTTDASLTPHHVDRGKLFVAERFSNNPLINVEQIQKSM